MATQHMRLVNKQYNSPINLYSAQNVQEALDRDTKAMSNGAVGANNFYNPLASAKPTNLQNSAILRMLEEEEEQRLRNGHLSSTKRVAWPPPREGEDIDQYISAQSQGGSANPSSPGFQNEFPSNQNLSPSPASSNRPLKPLDISSAGQIYSESPKSPILNQSPSGFKPQTYNRSWAPVQSPVPSQTQPNLQAYQTQPRAYQPQAHQPQAYQPQAHQPQTYQPQSQTYQSNHQYTNTHNQFSTSENQQSYQTQKMFQPQYQSSQYQNNSQQYLPQQNQSFEAYNNNSQQKSSVLQYNQPQQQDYNFQAYESNQPASQAQAQYQSSQQTNVSKFHYQTPGQSQPQYNIPSQQTQLPQQQCQFVQSQNQSAQQQQQRLSQQHYQASQQLTPLSNTQPQSPQSQPFQSHVQQSLEASPKPVVNPKQIPNQQNTRTVELPPSTITLRPQAPVNQAPPPVYTSQPATATLRGGKHLRGDLKWPPENVKIKMEEEKQMILDLEKGPMFKPRRVDRDYSPFFEQHALNSTYPGYKIPPGTQFYRPV